MEFYEGILIMLGMVLLSNIINRFFPSIAIPLIQVTLGFLIGVLTFVHSFELSSEVFMLVFLAPLLFNDGQMVDKKSLWKEKKAIFILSIGLVFLTVGLLGYVIHWIVPTTPWAACFALAAALAPTDAVAVAAFAEKVHIPHRMYHTLEAESLINDASGLVSFQFASAALLTGMFSITEAEISFIVISAGGLLVGLIIGYLGIKFVKWMKSLGIENDVSYILFELLLPYIIFLTAESFSVNGILAVVSGGIVYSWTYKKINPDVAHLNVLSKSTWSIYSFSLNGLVFVLLGTQLPELVTYVWYTNEINNWTLLGYVLLVTFILLSIRFITILIFNNFDGIKEKRNLKKTLLYTVSGVRGTITLVSAMSLPAFLSTGEVFLERELLISIAAGVIITTLLLANFTMPLLAEEQKSELTDSSTEIEVNILRKVTEQLKRKQTEQNSLAIRDVIQLYTERIISLINTNELSEKNKELMELVLIWKLQDTLNLVETGQINLQMAFRHLEKLDRRLYRLTHKPEYNKNAFYKNIIGPHLKFLGVRATSFEERVVLKNKIRESNRCYVLSQLRELDINTYTPEMIHFYIVRYEDHAVDDISYEDTVDEWLEYAIQLERTYVQQAFEKGMLSRQELSIYRGNLSVIESSIQFIS